MYYKIIKLQNQVQDTTSEAWMKLCAYIDALIQEGGEEFCPREYLGDELLAQIYTLPPSIGRLTKVKKMDLYGSALTYLPPEIGQMTALEYFDPYTSYNLHWFPYEITRCQQLMDSRVSTRALIGNYNTDYHQGIEFINVYPDVSKPVRVYDRASLSCSVCDKHISQSQVYQLWTKLDVGTDTLPLLANVCSTQCAQHIPNPIADFPTPHQGGLELYQDDEAQIYKADPISENPITTNTKPKGIPLKGDTSTLPIFKVVKKIWEEGEG